MAVDPRRADTVYALNTNLYRSEDGGRTFTLAKGSPGGDDYHELWTLPLAFSRRDPRVLYFANQKLFRTEDGGRHWSAISPDLTREDPGVPATLDPATAATAPRPGPRRHLRDRALARGRRRYLGRHRRRPRVADPRRGADVD